MDLGPLLAAIFISLLGLPHGALDPVVAYQQNVWRRLPGLSLFLCAYILLAIGMIVLWWAIPLLGLIVFLSFSALHFGRDYLRYSANPLDHWAYGGVIIGLPIVLDQMETVQIFDYLLFGPTPLALVWALQLAGIVSALYLVIHLRHVRIAATVELAALLATAIYLDPLWYFVVFFCGLHSPRHLMAVYRTLNSELRFVGFVVMLFLTIMTLLAAVTVAMQVEASALQLNSLVLQILFIGLAGLTVPHMLLIEWTRDNG